MLQQPWHPQPQEGGPCWDPISARQALGELPYFCRAGPAAPCALNQSLCSLQVFFLLRYKFCVFSKGSWSENVRLATFTQACQACSWPCWQLLDEAPGWHGFDLLTPSSCPHTSGPGPCWLHGSHTTTGPRGSPSSWPHLSSSLPTPRLYRAPRGHCFPHLVSPELV